jgi:hypothetical protein
MGTSTDAPLAGTALRAKERGGKRARRGALSGTRRTDEQVGVHRRCRGNTELGHGLVLADDVVVEGRHD